MAFLKYAVPAVAVGARLAAAQCSAATTTIQNAGDASALAACSTFTGSIAIATGTTDNIALNGIQRIQGSLIADTVPNMASLTGDSLSIIDDSFTLNDITILTTLSFPRLIEVDTISWLGLPNLQALSFTTGIQMVSDLDIENTQLGSLDGINLATADNIIITNNGYLQDINMQLGNVTQSMTLSANGNELKASFPNLIWANNLTLWNITDLSLPSLASVNGSLGFYSGGFSSLTLANLTSVGQSLSIVSSDQLTNVSMPELTIIGGGFQIANNSQLETVDGFPKLATIGGAVDFNGAFENVSFPEISDVRGAFTLLSTNDVSSSCATFSKLGGSNGVIKGHINCPQNSKSSGGNSSSGGSGSSGSGSGDSGSSSGNTTDTGAASGLIIPGATGLSFVAVLFGLLL